jgi:hypothetical protein
VTFRTVSKTFVFDTHHFVALQATKGGLLRGAPVDSGMPAHRLRPDNRYLFVRPDSGKMHHQVVERGYEEALKT